MSRVATAALALTVTVGLAGAAFAAKHRHHSDRKKGRVVRVERTPGGRALIPRLCGQVQPDGTVSCWGRAIEPGEIGSVFDENGKRADIRVDTVTAQMDGCNNTVGWNLTTTAMHGTLDALSYQSFAVFDWRGGDQTRTLYNNGQIPTPGNKLGETVLAALDDDTDDIAELIVTYFQCDISGNPAAYGAGGGAYCVSYYRRDTGTAYSELRTDVVRSCY